MIDFTPIASILVEILVVVLGVLGSYLIYKVKKHFDITDNGVLNDLLNEAVTRGVDYAEVKLRQAGKSVTVETSNEAVATAANYIIKGVPKAIAQFGLTEERIKEIVESRLNEKLK
jgi:hypothetical protein